MYCLTNIQKSFSLHLYKTTNQPTDRPTTTWRCNQHLSFKLRKMTCIIDDFYHTWRRRFAAQVKHVGRTDKTNKAQRDKETSVGESAGWNLFPEWGLCVTVLLLSCILKVTHKEWIETNPHLAEPHTLLLRATHTEQIGSHNLHV